MKFKISNVFILSISMYIPIAVSFIPHKPDVKLNSRSNHGCLYTHSSALLKLSMSKFDSMDSGADYTDNHDDSEKDIESGLTYSKKKLKRIDSRDTLPFDIYFDNEPNIKVASYMLDASTACGDIVDLGMSGGGVWNVKKVSFLYKYELGQFRVFRKKLHLTSLKNNNSGSSNNNNNRDNNSSDNSIANSIIELNDIVSYSNAQVVSPFKSNNDETTYLQ